MPRRLTEEEKTVRKHDRRCTGILLRLVNRIIDDTQAPENYDGDVYNIDAGWARQRAVTRGVPVQRRDIERETWIVRVYPRCWYDEDGDLATADVDYDLLAISRLIQPNPREREIEFGFDSGLPDDELEGPKVSIYGSYKGILIGLELHSDPPAGTRPPAPAAAQVTETPQETSQPIVEVPVRHRLMRLRPQRDQHDDTNDQAADL